MLNGKQFREALKVIHNMEFDDFCSLFGWQKEYAKEKYSLMQKGLIYFVGQLDDNNIEVFFGYLVSKLPPNSVNLIKDMDRKD